MTKLTVNVDFITNQFIYQLIEEEDRKLPIYKKIKFNLLEEKVWDNDTDEYFCTKEETTEENVPDEDDLNLIYLISDLKKRSLFLLFSCILVWLFVNLPNHAKITFTLPKFENERFVNGLFIFIFIYINEIVNELVDYATCTKPQSS